eukprot:1023995-Heterocapsa_arctica.AAC.1
MATTPTGTSDRYGDPARTPTEEIQRSRSRRIKRKDRCNFDRSLKDRQESDYEERDEGCHSEDETIT